MIDPSTIIPLRVPSNWFVHRNNFYDLDAIEGENGDVSKELKYAFNFELLILEQLIDKGKNKEVDEEGYLVDFGWAPNAKIDGHYICTLIKENRNNKKLSVKYKDRHLMQQIINFCLMYVNDHNETPDNFEEIVEDITNSPFSNTYLKSYQLLPLKIFAPIGVFENNFYDQPPEKIFTKNNQLLLRLKRANPNSQNGTFNWVFDSFEILLRLQQVEHKYWYHLQITHDEEESALFEFQHQDRYIIQAVVNLCTEVIAYADVRDIIDDFRKRVAKTVQALEQSST